MMVKIRDSGHVQNQAIYVVLGVDLAGQKEVLGLWTGQQEGAKFWLQVLTELKNTGVKDILIACVDGLKGFPEAIETIYPHTEVQLCIGKRRSVQLHADMGTSIQIPRDLQWRSPHEPILF